jgi:hypothetical protein
MTTAASAKPEPFKALIAAIQDSRDGDTVVAAAAKAVRERIKTKSRKIRCRKN